MNINQPKLTYIDIVVEWEGGRGCPGYNQQWRFVLKMTCGVYSRGGYRISEGEGVRITVKY